MFKWNKENGLSMSLKVEFKSLILKCLVILSSELTVLMKLSALEFAAFAVRVNLTWFLVAVCLNYYLLKVSKGEMVYCKAYSTNESFHPEDMCKFVYWSY